MANWLGIDSDNLDSYCDHTSLHVLTDALDGIGQWLHYVDHTHWFIIDLGAIYTVTKVRGRSDSGADPINVNIYVSNDKENWGSAVATAISTWQDTATWQEVNTSEKDGRYVKVEIIGTEHGTPGNLNFGRTAPFTIFDVYGGAPDLPGKPTNPSPAHQATGVNLGKTPVSYTASDPAADSYNIYFGVQGEGLTKIANVQNVTSWMSPYVILEIGDYNPATLSGYRSPIVGDELTHENDIFTILNIEVGDLVNVQYEARLFCFRVGPGGKNPGDVLTNGVAPNVENPQAVRVTLNDSWHFSGRVEKVYFSPGVTYEWRVDATNLAGTIAGDTWTFGSITFYPPLPGTSGVGGGGGTGEESSPTGESNMLTLKRLVAVAANKLWYEDI